MLFSRVVALGKWAELKGRGDSSPPPTHLPFVGHFSIRKSWKMGRVLEGGDELPLPLNSGHLSYLVESKFALFDLSLSVIQFVWLSKFVSLRYSVSVAI